MKVVIDIPYQIKECLNDEREWTALLLAELKDIVNNGIPLEQEPQTDLDKIRAEIADLEEGISSYHNDRPWVFKDEILQIIDKYRNGGE